MNNEKMTIKTSFSGAFEPLILMRMKIRSKIPHFF